MRILKIACALLVSAGMAQAHNNANGFGYFALEVPSDVTITADGSDADWGWFDNTFAVLPDEMFDVITETIPPKSDIDLAAMTA